MNVRSIRTRHAIGLLITIPLLSWYVATPVVIIHYPKEATDKLWLIWNTQHSIHKEGMFPGQSTFDTGHIFPNENFFMMFDWESEKSGTRCIDITPKLGRTIDIYLDQTGKIDTTNTSAEVIARLKQCKGDPDPFRP